MKKRIITMVIALALTVTTFANSAFADYYSDKTVLRYGMWGSQVTSLQKDLKDLGYFSGRGTGYFGDVTKQSVISFQRANNLSVDGIVGRQTAREIKVDKVVKTAKGYQGVPYVWGGTSPAGFDCSGFTHYVFLKNGITIPRTSALQYNSGTWVSKSQLKPGDLVFFTTYKPGPSHVGIYIGNNKFLNASTGQGKIVVADLDNPYWAPRFIGAKRIIQ